MNVTMKTPLVCTLLAASLVTVTQAQVGEFSDDFTGATLDSAWSLTGNATFDAANDWVQLTSIKTGGSTTSSKLIRSVGGSLSDYTAEITVDLATLTGSKSDFKWKTFGANGFTEIVVTNNSNIRMFHNDQSSNDPEFAGNVFNTGVAFSDSDVLTLTREYVLATDTLTVSYTIGGSAFQLYSGNGIQGSFGDVITNNSEAELFQFGDEVTPTPVVNVLSWSVTAAVPEPGTYALLAGCFALASVMIRRRR